MKVKMYGTRGSIPVSGEGYRKYGGNTTCLEIKSPCLPAGEALIIDAGSGITRLSRELLARGVNTINLLFTHYHQDHTMGLTLAPHVFRAGTRFKVIGPTEHRIGPKYVLKNIFKPPFFPVPFDKIGHKFEFRDLSHIGNEVIVFHPVGGRQILGGLSYEKTRQEKGQVSFNGKKFLLEECMVILCYKTMHPEYTVSYRIEELPTQKVFVFLTDHECTAGFPFDLKKHVTGASLLVADAQYSHEDYLKMYAGFGHGTPTYCVDLALATGVKVLGMTHHDPGNEDAAVEERLLEAQSHLGKISPENSLNMFICQDYQELDV